MIIRQENEASTTELPSREVVSQAAVTPTLPDLATILSFIWRHMWLALGVAILCAILAGAAITALPSRYAATSQIQVDLRERNVVPFPDIVQTQAPDPGIIASIVAVANSDATFLAIIRDLHLEDDPEIGRASILGKSVDDQVRIRRLRSLLSIDREGVTYLISVTMRSTDPEKAARIANAVANLIATRQHEIRAGGSQETANSIADKLRALRATAKASDDVVVAYRKAHALGVPRADGTIGERQANYLAQQLAQTRDRLDAARARHDALRRASPTDAGAVPGAPASLLETLRTQYAAESRSAAELAQTFGPRYPSVKASNQRLAVLRRQIKAELDRQVAVAQTEVNTMRQQVDLMEAELQRRQAEEIDSGEQRAELDRLERQAAIDRDVLDQFTRKQRVLSDQKDVERSDITTVSPALVPTFSTKPGLPLVSAAGGIAGLALGYLIGLIRDWRRILAPKKVAAAKMSPAPAPEPDVALRTEDGARKARFGLPPLAGLLRRKPPPPAREAMVPRDNGGTALVAASIHALPRQRPVPASVNAGVLNVADASGYLASFFGRLRNDTTLPDVTVMAVAALGSSVGTTTVAMGMVRLAASAGASVLLISDHGLGGTARPGLRDVVAGFADLRRLCTFDRASGFTLLRSGCASAAEFWQLADQEKFAPVIGMLRDYWDLVVIELPSFPDNRPPRIAENLVDLLLLISDPRRIPQADVADAIAHWPRHFAGRTFLVENAPTVIAEAIPA